MVGVAGDSKPLLCIKYAIKYGTWDSNPEKLVPKTSAYAIRLVPHIKALLCKKTGIEPVT